MRIKPAFLLSCGAVLSCLPMLLACDVWAYRPFVSTDAAVADPQEAEIEFGYFGLERTEGQNTFVIPSIVFNYGVISRLEGVAEFKVEKASGEDIQLADPALSLKAILKEGVLQGKEGASLAIEMGLLFPSTVRGERRVGFEGVGILSGRLSSFIFHINLGGGGDRADTNPFVVWGVIGELPVTLKWRLVGEINGESARGKPADNSGLLGFIWQSPRPNLFIDAGVRRGISRASPDWQFTTGLTVGFSVPSFWNSLSGRSGSL